MSKRLPSRSALNVDDEEYPRHAVTDEREGLCDAVALDAMACGHPFNDVRRDTRRRSQNSLLEFGIPQFGRLTDIKMI